VASEVQDDADQDGVVETVLTDTTNFHKDGNVRPGELTLRGAPLVLVWNKHNAEHLVSKMNGFHVVTSAMKVFPKKKPVYNRWAAGFSIIIANGESSKSQRCFTLRPGTTTVKCR
jgi:hypothetical protein